MDKKKKLYKINVKELSNKETIKEKIWFAKVFHTKHVKRAKTLAYRISDGKKVFVYGGDGSDCKNLRKACEDVDLALLEATMPSTLYITGHSSAEEAGKIANESNVKTLVLTHIAPIYFKKSNPIKDAKKHFKGGGHKNAAGGSSYGTLRGTVRKLKQILPEYKDQLNS